ncbi:set domain containing protein [Grosmannia clavigera kw1407]|uniref:Histone-lysine N-methyltransferase SET9 n=1 Tax=Grosmannia clavigera (strain kw1407 / UAMH 11150) TaxID=655863 RepID=F0XNX1_GROCL|nr:set domain containing protein [Grosmannia clavigera kw1407]EFX00738.1 set domain containing protein [Grosmannia clavigera kw1407]
MPPAKSRSLPTKKHALTLAQLASYDDILTDALVDHAYYWTSIPKNRPSYLPSRGVKEDEITKIIQTHLAVNPDIQIAEEKLLATTGLAKFYRALKTDREKQDFRCHMRRYMQIYLPDCPYEVASTNRYTIFQQEASISARRFIKSHETIKYLSGIQVVITPEEEAQLSERKKDFSIVISSRKKEVNLFMGPARFANHDCDANARLVTTGQSGIEIIATKPIGVGDEITVTYGENYFGEDNCECLCKTCEGRLVNGWAPGEGTAPVKRSIEVGASTPTRGYSFRRRDENPANRGRSETPSLTPIARPKVRRTKLRISERAAESTPASDSEHTGKEAAVASRRRGHKRDANSLATPPITPAKRQNIARTDAGMACPAALSTSSREGSTTDNNDDGSGAKYLPTRSAPTRSADFGSIAQSIEVAQDGVNSLCAHDRIPTSDPPAQLLGCRSKACVPISARVLSPSVAGTDEVAIVEEDDAMLQTIVVASINTLSLPPPESTVDSSEDDRLSASAPDETTADSVSSPSTVNEEESTGYDKEAASASVDAEDEAGALTQPSRRVPGDYTLTPLLLSEPETAWVFCTVCSKAFVQRDAYYTRMSCPRCERHSKLYGYLWPKTEPEGKWDKEERILDHRLVHRFLDANDEAKARGRKRPIWQAEPAEDAEPSRRKRSSSTQAEGLGSGIWRKLKYMMPKEETPSRVSKRGTGAGSARGLKMVQSVGVATKKADASDAVDGMRCSRRFRKAGSTVSDM